MTSRTIKSILEKKFALFLASITDESVRHAVKSDTIITGGCIASMFLNEDVNDFDIYFRTKATARAVAAYYASDKAAVIESDDRVMIAVNSDGLQGDVRMDDPAPEDSGAQEAVNAAKNDGTFRVLFLSANAITLSDQIQIVIRFYGEPDKIHENFDFAHCTNYWLSREGELIVYPWALEALLTRELRYVGSKYPLCSIIRTRKFIRRGWKINAGQFLKMALQLNELDLLDIETLQDQLIGVDSAHFIDLIERLKSNNPEKVNAAYVTEIINRIF